MREHKGLPKVNLSDKLKNHMTADKFILHNFVQRMRHKFYHLNHF